MPINTRRGGPILEDLERKRALAEQDVIAKQMKRTQDDIARLKQKKSDAQAANDLKQIQAITEQLTNLEDPRNQAMREFTSILPINQAAASEIMTQSKLSNVQRQIVHESGSVRSFMSAKSDPSLLLRSSAMLEREVNSLSESIGTKGERLSQITGGLQPVPSDVAHPQYKEFKEKREQQDKEAARLKEEIRTEQDRASTLYKAQKLKKVSEFDEEKSIRRADEQINKYESMTKSEERISELRKQKTINVGDYRSKYETAVEGLKGARTASEEAQKDLIEGMRKTDLGEKLEKSLETLSTAADTASKNLNDLQKQVDETEQTYRRAQIESRKREDDAEKASDFKMRAAMFGLGAVKTGFQAYEQVAFYGPARATEARTRTIGIANQQYFNAKSAVMENDVSAAYDFMRADEIAKQAEENASNTFPKTTAALTTGAAMLSGYSAGAGLSAVAKKLGPKFLIKQLGKGVAKVVAGSALGPVGTAVGLASTAYDLYDAFSGTTMENTRNDEYGRLMAKDQATRAIQMDKMQTYYNTGIGLYRNTMGLGSTGVKMQNTLLNDQGTINDLALQGISVDKASSLMSTFRQAGKFSVSSATDVLKTAGAAELRGVMSADQYTGMATQMMGMGGSASDMERILKFAVSEGMDNAKSISELVSATQSMSSELAAQGIGATSAVQESLMGAVGALNRGGMDPNLSTGAAANRLQSLSEKMGDTSVSLPTIMETFGLRKSVSSRGISASGGQLSRLQEMSFEEYQVLMKGGQGAYDLAVNKGLKDVVVNKDSGKVDTELITEMYFENNAKSLSLRNSDITAEGESTSKIAQQYIDKFKKAKTVQEKQSIAEDFKQNQNAAYGQHQDVYTTMIGAMGTETGADPLGKLPKGGGADQQVNQAKFMADILKTGKDYAESLGKNATAMENLNKLMSQIVTANEGKKAEGKSAAAGDVGKVVSQLEDGSRYFRQIMASVKLDMDKRAKAAADSDIPSSEQ